MRTKRLCIDVNSIVPLFINGYLSGVGRTTFELVNAIANINELPFEVILYSQNMKGIGGVNLNLPFKNKHLYYPYREEWNKILNSFPVKEIFMHYDLMHVPHNFEYLYKPSKAVITLHDALFMKMQEEAFPHEQMKKKVPILMKKCRAIVTCSKASKNDIVDYMDIEESKIEIIPWGISKKIFYPEEASKIDIFKEKNAIKRSYFVMVSCSEGRKNTISLLRAYKLYLKEGGQYDLILLWGNPPEWILKEFDTEIKNQRVHFLHHINESELRALYSGAIASFFPSKYEGFGLPVLESMACGTPVVTCENSSLKEIGSDVALYTEPEDLEHMKTYMFDFETGKYDLILLQQKGILHSSQYTWEKTANAYVNFYEKFINE